jgi:hypothetical protein
LGWGFVLLIFGLLMVFFAKRTKRREGGEPGQPASSTNGGGH